MTFDPTDEQAAILSHDCGCHARVLAGPGTGKSTTMVAWLGKLLEENDKLRVRMLTFTRAATAELAEKIASHAEQAERPSTIHSFAISVLLRNPGAGGFPEPLRIPDTWEFKNIIRPTLADRAGVEVRLLDKLIQEMASNWESLTEDVDPEIDEKDRTRFRGAWMEHRRVLGYTLLQELPYALLRALEHHGNLDGIDYDLLIVDEYQDLNSCDLQLLKLLSEISGCVVIGVGDDDQSIYSWRKAAPVGIRRFLDDYDSANDYSLSVTLRCGKRIIEWANYVIQGDPDRPSDRAVLDPLAESPDGEVGLLHFRSDAREAEGIADLVEGLVEEGLAPNDILILMRTDHNGTFSNPIRTKLEERGIPYSDPSVVLTMLNEPDNRRLIERLRLIINRGDSIAWASLLRLTPGIGETFFQYVYGRAKDAGTTFAAELLKGYDEGFPDGPRSARNVKNLMDSIVPWLDANQVPEDPPENGWGHWILEAFGEDGVVSTPTEDFSKLLTDLDEFAEEKQSLGRYISQIEPLGRDLAMARSEGVRIMTMGGSKGLTVRATIVAGVENGLVPRPFSDLSEERRILYVAMTRAKEFLFCTWATRRRGPTARAGQGTLDLRQLSGFLEGGPVDSEEGPPFIENRFQ
jgi:DNA helicase-2/ATP-dependent DNA helicase PcrA